jgi:dihydroorotase
MSLLITNCKVLIADELEDRSILIEDGLIKEIGEDLSAEQVFNAKGCIVIPGVIDSHVHFREPGYEHKEDFFTGSCAAAAGGVTTVLDMPNNNPPTLTQESLDLKRKLAQKSIVNYGFHFGSTNYNLDEIKKIRNVASTKVFLGEATGKLIVTDDKILEAIFMASKLVTCHAEGNTVKKAVSVHNETLTPLYLCHISTKGEIEIISKSRGKIYVEVAPHNLFLTKDYEDMLKGFALVNPRLGYRSDQELLWKAINSGMVSTIASDHAPHTAEEKTGSNPPPGIPGVETMLPLLLNAVSERKLTLQKMVELVSTNPAKIFRLNNKGLIKEGYDADLTVVDMRLIKTVKDENMHSKCGWTPYNGMSLRGWPVATIVGGNIVYDGAIHSEHRGREVDYE